MTFQETLDALKEDDDLDQYLDIIFVPVSLINGIKRRRQKRKARRK